MPLYQIRTVLKQDKIDEFLKNLRLLWFEFLKEEGCLSYRVYQEFEKENIVFMVGEFNSHEAMADHFQTQNFEVLIGASTVLGKGFKMTIAEPLKTGDLDLAKSLMSPEK